MEIEEMSTFRHFGDVSDHSDLRLLESYHDKTEDGGVYFTNSKSKVYKSIMREWKILEQNLPETIYVRVYENHIDLMRAAIVGVAGTPYQDNLFFFDIAFPSDYPNNPPKIHFHSFGLNLNPNLYANGKICLSLLNTWFGKKSEKWDPSSSTLLQVLLSIQGIILTEKPLFNDPLFGKLGFESMSRSYNELVFIHTCYLSRYLIQNPPKNFEALIRSHYRERAFAILAACNEYVNGRVRIGYYNCNDGASGSSSKTEKVSKAFKGHIERCYPEMFRAFIECGASLETSMERLELQGKRSRSHNGRNFKKVMAKIKRALGWKGRHHSHGSASR